MNLLLEKKILGTFTKFCEKNVLCEKGDEITRFDGTTCTWSVPPIIRTFCLERLRELLKVSAFELIVGKHTFFHQILVQTSVVCSKQYNIIRFIIHLTGIHDILFSLTNCRNESLSGSFEPFPSLRSR
jgi:hypothetical protein